MAFETECVYCGLALEAADMACPVCFPKGKAYCDGRVVYPDKSKVGKTRIEDIERNLTELICLLWRERHGDFGKDDVLSRLRILYERFGKPVYNRTPLVVLSLPDEEAV